MNQLSATAPSTDAVTITEECAGDRSIALLIFLLSLAYLRFFFNYTTINHDEGFVLQGAQRILGGEMPHRDFFSFFTPGSYYWMALFFKLFGSSMGVARAVLMVEGALFSVFTYLAARRVASRASALLAAYCVTLTCLPFRFSVLHNWDSTLWACLALYAALRFLERPGTGWALATGSLTALTCLFEQSKGAGLVLGLSAGFLILAWISRHAAAVPLLDKEGQGVVRPHENGSAIPLLDKEGSGVVRPHENGGAVPLLDKEGQGVVESLATTPNHFPTSRGASIMAAGFAAPFLLTFLYYGLHHGLPQLLADWLWPLHHYYVIAKTPLGYQMLRSTTIESIYSGPPAAIVLALLITAPWYIVPVLPFLAIFGLIYWSTEAGPKDSARSRNSYYVLTSATLAGLLAATLATGRPDFTHLVYQSPLFFLVLAWIVDGRDIRSSFLKAVKPLLVFLLLLSFTAFALTLLWPPLHAGQRLETRRGTLKAESADHVIPYVQDHVAPGETMLVYPYMPFYYYLTATRSPWRYEYIMPGFNTPEQLQEFLAEFAADRTRVVLFEPSYRQKLVAMAAFPSITPEVLAARDPVEDYITTHYRACASLTSQNFWRFAFMIRKDLPCPAR